ncbi:hypothetical protein C2S52_001907 [Perilla frutescens var. hirtella]|nr:hypothetical protein C2S52_001907 [Perilla frutescens var. hirtella]
MKNSGASESTEIASHVSNTQHTSGVAKSERNYDLTVQDIENQNMQVAIEIETPIVMGTSVNQQQHTVQDIENRNLEEFDGAPPNFVQQQHTVQDNDPNQNWQGVSPASPSLILQLPDTIQDDGSQTSEGVDAASPSVSLRPPIQVNTSEISEEFDEAPPNIVQQQHTDQGNDPNQNWEGIAAASPSVWIQDNGSQTSEGNGNAESMYNAALYGDWTAAEEVLGRDPNLAYDHITEEGDRALHVAAARKHKEFVQKLVKRMSSPSDLELLDGHGCTACCYAAMSGVVEIARVMIEENQNLATVHDENNETPLHKAALRGNKKMVSYFMEHFSKVDQDLSRQEWFDLLLVTIRSGMYDAAIKILLKNGSIATMANEEGTALHLLARRASSDFVQSARDDEDDENDASDFDKLAGELWAEMLKMGNSRVLELIKKPRNILHDAAKEGHAGIVTMLIRTYPQLIRDTDSNGYTIFHTAVKYRHIDVFSLIKQVYPMMDLRTLISQDESGDNILHLAAKSAPSNVMKLTPVLLLKKELQWFEAVETILPPSCVMLRNKDELSPRDLFSEEHKTLLKNSEMWMRNMADSCMLIATIFLSVMFAAAFTVPGGYDSQTGEPILVKRHWFKVFVVFETMGIIASVLSIIMFRSIMASSFAKEDFVFKLEKKQMVAFQALLWSLVCAFSAFMSSIVLFNMKMNGLVWFGFWALYFAGGYWLIAELSGIKSSYKMNRSILSTSTRHTIFNQYPTPLNSTA